MRGIYIYYKEIDEKKTNGIEKKVLAQIQLFRECGMKCELIFFPCVYTVKNKILDRIPFTNVNPHWEFDERFKNIDYIYLRRPEYMGYGFRKFLRKVKKENPTVKIIMEIPTYPYDKEILGGPFNLPLYIKDCYNRKRLKGYVDKIPVIGDIDKDMKLWGIDTIPFVNGIQVKNVRLKKDKHNENEINVICVSTCEFWHGFDRLFEGLKKYYDKVPNGKVINIHVVGDGSEKEKYVNDVKNCGIDKYVHFYGMLYGEELDEVYDKCDIACASLGLHRIGVKVGSFLKTREYLAKGMPMLLGCKIDVIPADFKYCETFEANDNPIEFEEVIKFYDRIYHGKETREEVIDNIRRFAEDTVDLQVTMKEITNYMLNN